MYVDILKDGADPGGTLGTPFTASLAESNVNPKGKFLDHLLLSVDALGATASVVLETFVGILTPFIFKAGQETRIQLRLRDLIALMVFYYKMSPNLFEETTATGHNRVLGVKIPIQETIDPNLTYTYSATRVAQTNQSGETLALSGTYLEDSKGRKPVVAVELPYTTAAATGYTSIGLNLPPVGNLIGLLVFQTTVPANTTVLYDIQRLQMTINGQLRSKFVSALMGAWFTGQKQGATSPLERILDNYTAFDFRDEPIDTKTQTVSFSADVETVSEAVRFIGVFEKA